MRNKIKISLLVTNILLATVTSALFANPDDPEFIKEHRSLRAKVLEEVELSSDNYAVTYMVQPETDNSPTELGHAILVFLGGSEEDPKFWAADFSAPFNIISALWSSEGKIKTSDVDSDKKSIFYYENEDKTFFLRPFSTWNQRAWPISKKVFKACKERIRELKKDPPPYNFFGVNVYERVRPRGRIGFFDLGQIFRPSRENYNCVNFAFDILDMCGAEARDDNYRIFGITAPTFPITRPNPVLGAVQLGCQLPRLLCIAGGMANHFINETAENVVWRANQGVKRSREVLEEKSTQVVEFGVKTVQHIGESAGSVCNEACKVGGQVVQHMSNSFNQLEFELKKIRLWPFN